MDELVAQSGIQSIDYIPQILELFCEDHSSLSLKEISTALNESPAKIFRYLVSLNRIGLLHKTENNEYQVGDLALDLSFRALNALDPIEEVCRTAKEISRDSGYGVAVSIWGSLGATVVKTYEATEVIYSKIRAGSVMSLINSSIGNTFAKHLPEHIVLEALEIDHLRHSGTKLSLKERHEFIKLIRSRSEDAITLMVDRPSEGLSSMSVPIFGISHEIQFVITAFHSSRIILEQQAEFEKYLNAQVLALSKSLGFQ